MKSRFATNLFALVGAGFLAVVSRSFGQTALEWVGFGVSAAILVAAIAGLTVTGRQRLLDAAGFSALGLVAGWSMVAALVFTGSALSWLVLADALGVAAVAIAELVRHELSSERVVHTLEIADERSELLAA